ncbi:melanopsin-like [Physella acuta]|uniref:melanopsin-like n=1 Tax=Physella acuta TaxID=109671 RepID=UPI0027DC679B|nr:melanopsin-like [Physella acuta]
MAPVPDLSTMSIRENQTLTPDEGPGKTTIENQTVADALYDDLSFETFMVLYTFLDCGFLHLTSIIGVVGNILNIIILGSHGMDETTNILLMSLSVSDLLTSLFFFSESLCCVVSKFDYPTSAYVTTFVRVYIFPNQMWVGVSFCLSTAIAIERCVAVLFPFHVGRVFTPQRVRVVVVFIYIYMLAICCPVFNYYDYSWTFDQRYNATLPEFVFSQYYLDRFDSLENYRGYFVNNLVSNIPLIIIIICSVFIIYKLNCGKSMPIAQGSSKTRNERKIAKMLLTVCLVTFFTYLPSSVIDSYLSFIPENLNNSLQYINVWLYQLNASSNFIIYVTVSKKFRLSYHELFCKCVRSKVTREIRNQ